MGQVSERIIAMSAEKRVAIYARVSTADQHADMQLAELREHAQRRGWPIYKEYVDAGISGAKSSRPELDKLMADARRRRHFSTVLVWKFDRFARSVSHLLAALEEFKSQGIDFVSLHESLDTATPMGKMVFVVVAAVAELERSLITERVRAGIARARAKGKKLGRPEGSKINVAKVMECRSRGMSIRRIAKALGIGVGSVQRALASYQKSPLKIGLGSPMRKAGR